MDICAHVCVCMRVEARVVVFNILDFLKICMSDLPVYMMCTTRVPGACGGQKRVAGPLELELYMAVSHYLGIGN